MKSYCCKKITGIIKRSNIKVQRCFLCLNRLHSFKTENKLELHKKVRGNKDFCKVLMPPENTKILEFNQYHKSDKALFIIYVDL